MSQPHLCPKCRGERRVPQNRPDTTSIDRECPVCRGAGVLWGAEATSPLAGTVGRYEAPTEPACPAEDWEAISNPARTWRPPDWSSASVTVVNDPSISAINADPAALWTVTNVDLQRDLAEGRASYTTHQWSRERETIKAMNRSARA